MDLSFLVYSILPIILYINISLTNGKPFDSLLRFLQSQEPDYSNKPFVEENNATPSWVDEQDLVAEYESSQSERVNDLKLRAIQKRRAANTLRSYSEGIEIELDKAKKKTNGAKNLDKFKLNAQLEANLARAALLYKQADLLDEQALEAKKKLENIHLSPNKNNVLIRDCNLLKIGPLYYSSRVDNVIHKSEEPLMAKLTGNSFMLYHNKQPQLTFYLVDVELPTKPVEDAQGCFSFRYRGAEEVLCSGTQLSAHTWMNAISEAWFCKNMGIKGTLVNIKTTKPQSENENTIMKHALKNDESNKGLINMEVSVDDKNKTHLLVNGNEKPVSAVSNILDITEILKGKCEDIPFLLSDQKKKQSQN
ncbi:hypothetical protein BEWA_008120 [Theileria equi strain WA]|uniref:PH domain-containing protein n=1 Tax=Theileria equi strain WA TaxID=1537102 RepID=L0B0P1_THEEQ|nr:hypothetical protein BEWA_008120 [Theileria equi strain WA]AFZ81402.1 hypothetical protein BEWA_008120 [Theileria equi strain WA]|eukprot:XP_004831068.1 hypothetical protein BEWA_008120 [Theileria equi strain WA]